MVLFTVANADKTVKLLGTVTVQRIQRK